jgi:hypothetical protein
MDSSVMPEPIKIGEKSSRKSKYSFHLPIKMIQFSSMIRIKDLLLEHMKKLL